MNDFYQSLFREIDDMDKKVNEAFAKFKVRFNKNLSKAFKEMFAEFASTENPTLKERNNFFNSNLVFEVNYDFSKEDLSQSKEFIHLFLNKIRDMLSPISDSEHSYFEILNESAIEYCIRNKNIQKSIVAIVINLSDLTKESPLSSVPYLKKYIEKISDMKNQNDKYIENLENELENVKFDLALDKFSSYVELAIKRSIMLDKEESGERCLFFMPTKEEQMLLSSVIAGTPFHLFARYEEKTDIVYDVGELRDFYYGMLQMPEEDLSRTRKQSNKGKK